ncbi:bis(5'-nucleosyl)-tetraphosphatase (symmetrical) YqeK [Elusimicrobiota bacterium]
MKRKPQKVLLFGGAFDPVHRGHDKLLRAASEQVRPDHFLLVPTGDKPAHKKTTLFPAKLRKALLHACFDGIKNIEILDYEIRRKKPTYTCQTLRFIQKEYPGSHIYLLVGSDNIHSLHTWKNANKIINTRGISIVAGKRMPYKPGKHGIQNLIWLKGVFPRAASSRMRPMIKIKNRPFPWKELPPGAAALLKGTAFDELIEVYLKARLPRERFKHTFGCVRFAQELAGIHNVDSRKVRIAGLLHDFSRTKNSFICRKEALAHGRVSARLARVIFGVRDQQILDAIGSHVEGPLSLNKIARVIFTADVCGYDRKYKSASVLRKIARKSLEQGFSAALNQKIAYLKAFKYGVHPTTLALAFRLLKNKAFYA